MAKTNDIQQIQTILAVEVDGVSGSEITVGAERGNRHTADSGNPKLKQIQKVLGVDASGSWGIESQTALNEEISSGDGFSCTASSFADPADVVALTNARPPARRTTVFRGGRQRHRPVRQDHRAGPDSDGGGQRPGHDHPVG